MSFNDDGFSEEAKIDLENYLHQIEEMRFDAQPFRYHIFFGRNKTEGYLNDIEQKGFFTVLVESSYAQNIGRAKQFIERQKTRKEIDELEKDKYGAMMNEFYGRK